MKTVSTLTTNQQHSVVFMMPELCLLILVYMDDPSLLAMYFTLKSIKPVIEKVIKDGKRDAFNGKKMGIRNLKESMICQSIESGYQSLVTFFIDIFADSMGSFNDFDYVRCAVQHNQLAIFKDLRKQRSSCTFKWDCFHALLDAASYGHFELLKYIIEECGGSRKVIKTFDKAELGMQAAKGGCRDILDYLYTQNLASFDVYSSRQAAMNGDLRTLQWLREKNCPWDEVVTFRAATRRHIEVLRWALENGCPIIYDNIYSFLNRKRDQDTIEWLNTNGICVNPH
jgi:hypothetical protein